MPSTSIHSTYPFAGHTVRRLGYGAMRLSGPNIFGPPKDHDAALAVLRAAVAAGVDHIDTSDFYGPHVTNRIIREALHPYPDSLVIVTKVGAVRGSDASWLPAQAPDDIRRAVDDNLRNLGLDVLDVVNLRLMFDPHAPKEGPIEQQMETLAALQQEGLVRHIGVSNATAAQVAQAQRHDDALIDALAAQGIAYVPYFPLGGFSPIQSAALSTLADTLGATPMQMALAWLLHRAPNILLIPGTSSVGHLRENLQAQALQLSEATLAELDALGRLEA